MSHVGGGGIQSPWDGVLAGGRWSRTIGVLPRGPEAWGSQVTKLVPAKFGLPAPSRPDSLLPAGPVPWPLGLFRHQGPASSQVTVPSSLCRRLLPPLQGDSGPLQALRVPEATPAPGLTPRTVGEPWAVPAVGDPEQPEPAAGGGGGQRHRGTEYGGSGSTANPTGFSRAGDGSSWVPRGRPGGHGPGHTSVAPGAATHPHQHGEDPRPVVEAGRQPRRQLQVAGLGVRVALGVRPPALQAGHPVVARLLPAGLLPRHGAADRLAS